MGHVSKAIILLLAAAAGKAGLADERGQFPQLVGPYLGQPLPGKKPVLFAPGIVSTDLHDDFSPAFTPDGREVFFRCLGAGKMLILHMKIDSGAWSNPEPAPFSKGSGDLGAFLSHDGNRLFFSSNRPASGTDTTGDLDIFAVDRIAQGWGVPFSVFPYDCGAGDLFACSADSAGRIYCYAQRSEGLGGYDLYSLEPGDHGYSKKKLLPPTINTRGDDIYPCISHDGSFLIYCSNGGPTGNGKLDLYVTFLNPDHSWSQPANLSTHLGLRSPAKFPGLSPDNRYLFFVVPESEEANRRLGRLWEIDGLRGAASREGGGNVYWVDASVLDDLRPDR